MARVPKKNISEDLRDIKWPRKSESTGGGDGKKPPGNFSDFKSLPPLPPRRPSIKLAAGFIFVALLFVGIYAAFGSGMLPVAKLTPSENNISATLRDSWQNTFSKTFDTYRELVGFSSGIWGLTRGYDEVEKAFSEALRGESGERLISSLKNVQSVVSSLGSGAEDIMLLGGISKAYPNMNLERISSFLESFIPWLEKDKPHRIALLFQNPSELRPGGGFLGSFGEITLERGAVKDLSIYDINDTDNELEEKIIPPKPISNIASRWFARDANWFFNFPDSAEKILSLIESSKLFEEKENFEGAVAISPKVMEDILALTGPVKIGEDLILDENNFLSEIQKDIQVNRAQNKDNPKSLLAELAPILMERISELPSSDKAQLAKIFSEWMKKKDIMIYSRDKDFQRFFEAYNWGGSLFALHEGKVGDYLAVVSSNMASGKSDLFVKKKISLDTVITADGLVRDILTIEMNHTAGKDDYWWYKTTNESYFKIYTPKGASPVILEGAYAKAQRQRDFRGFSEDSLVKEISEEKTYAEARGLVSFSEAERNVFGFWSRISPGEKKIISLQYERRLGVNPANEMEYEFVFEKQAGAEAEYEFSLLAPPGFIWKDIGSPLYEFKTDDPEARIVKKLIFVKYE